MEEPWTNRMVPSGDGEAPALFSHRKSFTGPLFVQCSRPLDIRSSGTSADQLAASGL
jgi:hypothetical protein